ncbi:MAG: glycosyltransferase [Calditrichaeota bacterium]|nr:glycosyltransferase [Calditrichota bacterium]
MIAILHGYLLEGSGSNLWTRSIVRSLVRNGETVHLMCQENHPEIYDFIAEAYRYRLDGSVETWFKRDVPYPGRCILHKPEIGDTLPVYVWDHYEEFPNVVPMVELPDEIIHQYLELNKKALRRILEEHPITVLHANHAVLMSVVAMEISRERGIPYSIMPHGSAIEYAVKKDPRFFHHAREAFRQAQRILVIGKEMRSRVLQLFPDIPDLERRLEELNLGVDTQQFQPIENNQREGNILRLIDRVKGYPRGKSPDQSQQLVQEAQHLQKPEGLKSLLQKYGQYTAKNPDRDVEAKLRSVDWSREKILLFVGRLIASKGLQSILAALPEIFATHPNSRLLVIGHGPLREAMELLVFALSSGNRQLAEWIVNQGKALEGGDPTPLITVANYWKWLQERGEWETYWKKAQQFMTPERVIFTGYLTHAELRFVFPCCDVAIFPSVVAEAGPLVFLEALSSGCFPLGTYFAGMAASIDSTADYLPVDAVEAMKIRADERWTVHDIAQKAPRALELAPRVKTALRQVAVDRYDWSRVAKRFSNLLHQLQYDA